MAQDRGVRLGRNLLKQQRLQPIHGWSLCIYWERCGVSGLSDLEPSHESGEFFRESRGIIGGERIAQHQKSVTGGEN